MSENTAVSVELAATIQKKQQYVLHQQLPKIETCHETNTKEIQTQVYIIRINHHSFHDKSFFYI